MRHQIFLIIASIGITGCSGDQAPQSQTTGTSKVATEPLASHFTAVASKAADGISGNAIRRVIAEISADSYGGRGPGSDGDTRAREYLAAALAGMGYEPADSNGGWQQAFELVGINAVAPTIWSFQSANDTISFERNRQFVVTSGVQAPRTVLADAELVFVGYGIQAPEYGWDDFKGQDMEGKVLVVLNNDPDWDASLFAGERRLYYGRWSYKYETAARQGAVGAIIVHTTPSAGYPWQVVETSWNGTQFELPSGDEARLQVAAWLTEDASAALVAMAGHDLDRLTQAAKSRDFQPVSLGIQTSIAFPNQISRVSSGNVLGLLKGSDPEIADEVVVYTAHHDHIGTAEAQPGDDPSKDRIYNGARDNASGVAMVLEIARAFSALPTPPRRSILIALVGAEEQGLLGSRHFAQNPPIAQGKMAANINFDSGNIWGITRDITYIGKGKSTLDTVTDAVAAHQGRTVKGDQFPDRGYFYRSDQFSLARVGVPALYLSGGTNFIGRPDGWGTERIDAYTAQNYHQPSDELSSDWNFEGMVRDAQFGFWAGLLIANAEEMPSWNAGDEFEAARKAALAQAEKP